MYNFRRENRSFDLGMLSRSSQTGSHNLLLKSRGKIAENLCSSLVMKRSSVDEFYFSGVILELLTQKYRKVCQAKSAAGEGNRTLGLSLTKRMLCH